MSSNVLTIDCEYLYPRFAASFLVKEAGRAMFVETNTAHAVPRLMNALQQSDLTPEQVDFIVITHVHLDHAGGAGALMKLCPNARLLAHPRAATHMIDPSRLVASARQVYGDETFDRLYGSLDPIPQNRVKEMADGEELTWGARSFRFLHTRGHANHHFCIYDSGSEGIFTGDSFGLAYPDLQRKGLFIFPSTSPTDFDSAEARKTIARILDTGARRAFLTHYGEVTDLQGAASELNRYLDFAEKLLQEAVASGEPDPELNAFCQTRVRAFFNHLVESKGLSLSAAEWGMLEMDIDLNGQGVAHVARKKRAGK